MQSHPFTSKRDSASAVEGERADAAVLKHPGMPLRRLAKLTGVPRSTLRRAIERLNKNPVSAEKPVKELPQPQARPSPIVAVEPEPLPPNIAPVAKADARTALGQFAPGPRPQPLMDRAKAAALTHPDMGAQKLAKLIGVSKKTVLNARKALNNFAPRPRPQPLIDKARAALAENPGMSAAAIGRMIGCSKKTVLNANNGIPVRRPRRRAVAAAEKAFLT